MNDMFANGADLPQSAYFGNTLQRARSAAEQRSHKYVTFEHLLFALMDDYDATGLLSSLRVDTAVLRASITDAVNNRMSALVSYDGRPPAFSYKFDGLMASASGDARLFGKREIDGALALVAIMRDPDSNASDMLAGNGFDLRRALQVLGTQASAQTPSSQNGRIHPAGGQPVEQTLGLGAQRGGGGQLQPSIGAPPVRDRKLDDMLANVRDILDADDRGGATPPPSTRPANGGPPRAAPRLSAENAPSNERPKRDDRRKQGKRDADKAFPGLMGAMPKTMRLGKAQDVEIRLSKEGAASLFQGLKGRSTMQANEAPQTRAVTLRLEAPEGGLTIETLSAETQWVMDRPSFLGEDTFGDWSWTLHPADRGAHRVVLSVSARDIDQNGLASALALPPEEIEVRVRRNYGSTLGRLTWWAILLISGGALTQGILYALKVAPKLPR